MNHRNDNIEMTRKINDFISHCDILMQTHPEKKPKKNFEVEFEYIEDQTRITPKESETCYKTSRELENEMKNRYPDVLANEKTRVKIDKEPGCTDYINANFIKKYNGEERGYITTQGPVENTIRDFWKMVWQYNIHVLVMLTKENENGVQKSCRYWTPGDKVNEKKAYDNFEITLISKEKDRKAGDDLVTRKFSVKNSKEPNKTREVIHFQYTGWPDHGLTHSHHFLHLMNLVDDAVEKTGGPICIHCSAGIGRTGTFCTIHMNIHKIRDCLKKGEVPEISVVKTVLKLRKQRHGMVQTKDQFLFCNQIIRDEYNRLTKDDKNEKNSNHSQPQNSNHSQPQQSFQQPVQYPQPGQHPYLAHTPIITNTPATQASTSSTATHEPSTYDVAATTATLNNSTKLDFY